MKITKDKFTMMTTEPIGPLVCKMAIPTVISMLVTALYNIVDTLFVGQIGTDATAGVGLILPVMAIIQAFGFFFGQGSGNYISRALGAKDDEHAEKMASTGAFFAIFFGSLILAIGFIFSSPILRFLGADNTKVLQGTVDFAGDYYKIILMGAPFMCLSCVLNNQLRFQGNAVFSMMGLVSGAVLNCGLDPLFIFKFGMEVKGAALATIISQATSCTLLFIGTLRSGSLRIRIKNVRPTLFYLKNIAVGGAPSLFRQGLSSLSALSLNYMAGASVARADADAAIAAFSVVGKVMLFGFSALLGFGQGFQPICGFNYGAKKYDRVRKAYTFCIKVGFFILLCASAIGFIFAPSLVSIFRNDPKVISYGTIAMRCQCSTFAIMSVVTITNMLYQNIGRVVGATLLAVARQGLMFVPVVLILPRLLPNPIWGVYLAQSVADIFAFALALPLGIKMYRELKNREINNI